MDPVLKQFLRGYAALHHTTPAKLLREILAEWAFERVDHTPLQRVDHTLRRLDVLFKQLQLKIAMLPSSAAGGSEPVLYVAGSLRTPQAKNKKHVQKEKGKGGLTRLRNVRACIGWWWTC